MSEEIETPVLILGRTWLETQTPLIDWKTNKISITRANGKKVAISPKKQSMKQKNSPCFNIISFRKKKVMKSGNC